MVQYDSEKVAEKSIRTAWSQVTVLQSGCRRKAEEEAQEVRDRRITEVPVFGQARERQREYYCLQSTPPISTTTSENGAQMAVLQEETRMNSNQGVHVILAVKQCFEHEIGTKGCSITLRSVFRIDGDRRRRAGLEVRRAAPFLSAPLPHYAAAHLLSSPPPRLSAPQHDLICPSPARKRPETGDAASGRVITGCVRAREPLRTFRHSLEGIPSHSMESSGLFVETYIGECSEILALVILNLDRLTTRKFAQRELVTDEIIVRDA
ncbi:hypothetical protein GGX14DRAFT_391814 [Mycena pura]|uniref:Uncharacterized protein n=1 Tax=Mycena pura TaxID=153505 RepID=A0AAD6VLJ9_9AGAR|nr:hypothetical protein GGX14DRAFT_391814 [Mycena pura]